MQSAEFSKVPNSKIRSSYLSRRQYTLLPPGIWLKNMIYHPKVSDFVFRLPKFQEGVAYIYAAIGADPKVA